MLRIYDPRTNTSTDTTYEQLEMLTGRSRLSLMNARTKKNKLNGLGVYIIDENTTLRERKEWYAREVLKSEAWQLVEGSGGKYLVSNHGRFQRIYKHSKKFIMPFQKARSKSLSVKVEFLNKRSDFQVAHLVAHHFIGARPPGMSVKNKNGIVTDNYAGNLEYIPRKEFHRLVGTRRKREVVQLNAETLELIDEFSSAKDAAEENHVSESTVLSNCRRIIKVTADEWRFMFADEYEQMILNELH